MDDRFVALDPALGLTPADFAAAWNADSMCRDAAEAGAVPGIAQTFDLSPVGDCGAGAAAVG